MIALGIFGCTPTDCGGISCRSAPGDCETHNLPFRCRRVGGNRERHSLVVVRDRHGQNGS